jgi:hypothetical protein
LQCGIHPVSHRTAGLRTCTELLQPEHLKRRGQPKSAPQPPSKMRKPE